MAELDLFDAEAFNQAFSEASNPYFERERLADFSLLTNRRALTMAQAVLLMLSGVEESDDADLAHAYGDYVRMVAFAVTEAKLEARHPATLLRWTECMEMLRAGMYGERGERAPLLHFGWIVGLDDLTSWLASLGFALDANAVLLELEGNGPAIVKRESNMKKWNHEFTEEVRQYRAAHTAKETAEKYEVSDSFIRRKLRTNGTGDPGPWRGLQ